MDNNELEEKRIKDIKKSSSVAFVIILIVFLLIIATTILGIKGVVNLFSNLSIN